MRILPRLHDAATHAPHLAFVGASGRRIGPLRLGRPRGEDVEVPRSDLAAILVESARDEAEFLGDTVTALDPDDGSVDVAFAHAAPRRVDLVVGADGLHSTVRALAFGPETHYARRLGLYIATLSLGRPAADSTSRSSLPVNSCFGRWSGQTGSMGCRRGGPGGAETAARHPPCGLRSCPPFTGEIR